MASAFPMVFARALGEPLLSGSLREHPEDFEVVEDLGFDLSGHGEHAFLKIRKTGANTAWVADGIARFARVRPFDVSYAGKKDRHAVTTQWFSCWLPGQLGPDFRDVSLSGVEVLEIARHDKKLRRGDHAGNAFRIRLRSMTADDLEMAQVDLARRVESIRVEGFPNYFGEQRFGHNGNNLIEADALLAGQEKAKAKRDLYISAARSYLFNLDLSTRIEDDSWRQHRYGWLAGISRRGDAVYAVDCFSNWHEGLERLGVKAMRRDYAVPVPDLALQLDNDQLTLTFSLPAGSYATSLLREIVAYNSDLEGEDLVVG